MPMDTAEVPLFHQPRVLSKMVQFHSRLASLQILKCITCLERFLGITVSFLLYLCIPLQLHSIRMRQILPFAHARPTMPCILLVIGASVSEPTLVVRKRYIRSRVIPQSSFYASFLISTHAQQRPVHPARRVDEETHGVFGSCRRGRGATVEATCRKATTGARTPRFGDRRTERGEIVETTSSVPPGLHHKRTIAFNDIFTVSLLYIAATSQYLHAPNITFRSRSPHNAMHSPSNIIRKHCYYTVLEMPRPRVLVYGEPSLFDAKYKNIKITRKKRSIRRYKKRHCRTFWPEVSYTVTYYRYTTLPLGSHPVGRDTNTCAPQDEGKGMSKGKSNNLAFKT